MAKLNIVNKEKPAPKYKCFRAIESELCSIVNYKNEDNKEVILCHQNDTYFPVTGDIIYIKVVIAGITFYKPYTNNTAYIPSLLSSIEQERKIKYLQTDENGVCKIINCNTRWQISQSL